MWTENLRFDGRDRPWTVGENLIDLDDQALLSRAELENCIRFPHDDRVLVVDGFDDHPCPYAEGPVFVWLTLAQHQEMLDALPPD